MSHTPGPWTISRQNGVLPDEGCVGIIGPTQTSKAGKQYHLYVAQYVDKKDAALVEAAPDLLELLRELHDFGSPTTHFKHREHAEKVWKDAVRLLRKLEPVASAQKADAN